MDQEQAVRKLRSVFLSNGSSTDDRFLTSIVQGLTHLGLLKLDEPARLTVDEAIYMAGLGRISVEGFKQALAKQGYEIRPKQTHSY
jgi:hypothetical protein